MWKETVMTQRPTNLPPAGWHADPTDSTQLRFWDGKVWTEQIRPLPPAGPGGAPTTGPSPEQDEATSRLSGAAVPQTSPPTGSSGRGPIPPSSMRPQVAPPRPIREAGFFRSLFDLSFASDRVVTISFARLIYLVVAIFSVLGWLVGAVALFGIGGQNSDLEYLQGIGVLHLALGPIGVFLTILFCRVALEVTIALIRTSQHTAKLVHLAQTPGSMK